MAETFRFEVSTDSGDVQAFAEALGLVASGEPAASVPLTFPMRWLGEEGVRAWIERALGGRALPVHETQDFAYRAPLAIGRRYALALRCEEGADEPARLVLAGEVSEGAAVVCALRTTILGIDPEAER